MDTNKLSFTVHGPKNPAIVALEVLRQVGEGDGPGSFTVDEDSFRRVAEVCGDVEAEGFVVWDVVDIGRLCELGKFQVALVRGVMRAALASEAIPL